MPPALVMTDFPVSSEDLLDRNIRQIDGRVALEGAIALLGRSQSHCFVRLEQGWAGLEAGQLLSHLAAGIPPQTPIAELSDKKIAPLKLREIQSWQSLVEEPQRQGVTALPIVDEWGEAIAAVSYTSIARAIKALPQEDFPRGDRRELPWGYLNEMLGEAKDLPSLFQRAAQCLHRYLAVSGCWIWQFDDCEQVSVSYCSSYPEIQGYCIEQQMSASRECREWLASSMLLQISCPEEMPSPVRATLGDRCQICSLLSLPMRSREKLVGGILVYDGQQRQWTPAETGFTNEVAYYCALAIERETLAVETALLYKERRLALGELQQAEELFAKAFYDSPVASLLIDLEQERICDLNQSSVKLLDCSEQVLLAYPLAKLPIWSHRHDYVYLRRVWQTRKFLRDRSVELVTRDGEVRHVLVSLSTLAVATGDRPVRAIATVVDITQQRRAEAFWRDRESGYRLLAENSQDLISRHSPKGVYLYASLASIRLLGYAPQELKGRSPYEFIHPEDVPQMQTVYQNLVDGQGSDSFVYRMRHRDGHYIWLETNARRVVHLGTGRIREIVAVSRDITPRKRLEERLRLAERAIASSGNGVIIVDARLPDLPIIYVNPAFERITGYSAPEVVGRNCRFLQGNAPETAGKARLARAIAAGEDCTVVLCNQRRDGTTFWNEMSLAPIYDERGTLTHFIGIQTDVTQRQQIEEQLRRSLVQERELSELKSSFITLVSHEFRTPLTTILASAELLNTCGENLSIQEQKRRYQRIQNGALQMAEMLEMVLTLHEAETGGLEFHLTLLGRDRYVVEVLSHSYLSIVMVNKIPNSTSVVE